MVKSGFSIIADVSLRRFPYGTSRLFDAAAGKDHLPELPGNFDSPGIPAFIRWIQTAA